MAQTTVLLVDDHPLIIEGLAKIISLDEAIKVVGKAFDGKEAVALAAALNPDVIVMDINMPGMDGVEACTLIKEQCSGIEVIALTVCEELDRILQVLKAGAKGYFLKDVEPERLVDAIKNVKKGQSFIHPQVAAKMLNQFADDRKRSLNLAKAKRLTNREEEVVKLIAQGLNNKEISASLFISEKTVKNHITNILRKLDLRDRVQVAIWAIEEKLI